MEDEGHVSSGWMTVGVSFITLALAYGAAWHSSSVFFVALLKEFNWSRSTVAGAFSVFMILHVIIGPFAGSMVDRFGPRIVFLVGALTLAAILTSLPGHGEIIRDVASRIDEITNLIERRKALVHDILDQGPCKPFSIVEILCPDLRGEQLFLALTGTETHSVSGRKLEDARYILLTTGRTPAP